MSTWQTKKLGDICDAFMDGDWIEKKDQSDCGIRLLQTGNIGNGYFKDRAEKARYISDETFKKLRCTEVVEGDCLVSRLPDPIGRSCVICKTTEKMITAVDCSILRFKKDILSKWFIYFSLSDSYQNQINKLISGATRQRISRNNLGLINIPITDILEQQRIVKILDETFDSIDKAKSIAEKNLQNSKNLLEAYLDLVFSNPAKGWIEKSLKEVCKYDKSPNKTTNLPYVGLEDIQSNTGKLVGPINPRSVKSLTFHFTKEHVLYGRLRPYLNKVLLPDFEGHCSTEIFPIKPEENILNREFLFHWLISTKTMNKINATWTGATLPRANMNTVLDFKINIPPISEQKIISEKINKLSIESKELESIYQQKLVDLDELKKSILNKAFNGEL